MFVPNLVGEGCCFGFSCSKVNTVLSKDFLGPSHLGEGEVFSEWLQTTAGQEARSLQLKLAPRLAHKPGCSSFAVNSQIQEIT